MLLFMWLMYPVLVSLIFLNIIHFDSISLLKFMWWQNSLKFSRADSCVKVWSFSDFVGTNSFPIFSVCWWFGGTETDD